jgi:hypothetical protein
MNASITRIALGFSVSAVCTVANAGVTLKLDGWANPEPSYVTVDAVDNSLDYVNGGVGPFAVTLDGASFVTYCTDLLQGFAWNTNYTYDRVDGAAAWGAQKAEDLGRLLTYVGGLGPVSQARGAAIQAAVWEILYENSGSYSFAGGNISTFGTDGVPGAGPNPQAALDAIVWSDVMATQSLFDVDQLYNGKTQDFLVAAPIPEPSTYALLLGGLGLVGFVARRRQAKADKA